MTALDAHIDANASARQVVTMMLADDMVNAVYLIEDHPDPDLIAHYLALHLSELISECGLAEYWRDYCALVAAHAEGLV